MKILYANDSPSAPFYIRLGQCRALRAAGNDVVMWDITKKCAFDAFSEFEPDLFIGQTYNVDRAMFKCIAARPDMRVALFASAYGELARTIDRKRFPIDIASEQEIRILEDLKKKTERPNVVFIHCPDRFVDFVIGGFNSIGIDTMGLMNAADIFSYLGGIWKSEYACDIGFVGGFWGYKGINIKKLFLPICHPSQPYKIKVFGNTNWNIHQYLGSIEEEQVKNLFSSATICPNISEPHSVEYGSDLVERIFKVPLSGFLISDKVDGLKDVFPDGVCPTFSSVNELMEIVDFYTKEENQTKRNELMMAQRQSILNQHTYFHRASRLMSALGLPEQEKMVLKVYGEILPKLLGLNNDT